MKRFLAIALAWLALTPARADEARDYAWRQTLTTSGREAVVQYRLPRSVYLHARSPALHDLRVFDSRGMLLPFALRPPAEVSQASRATVPVRVFPVYGAAEDTSPVTAVEIRRTPDGALVSVGTRAAPREGDALSALVLDMRAAAPGSSVNQLRLTLPPGTPRYDARLCVEASDDLKAWRELAESHVSWMVSGDGAALAADRIAFAPQQFRYARIRWLEGQPIRFAAIGADTVQTTAQPAPLETLILPASTGRNPGELLYASAPAIPVQRIGLEFAERNVSLPVELGSYAELPAVKAGRGSTWRFQPALRATFYRIEQGGRERRSGDLSVAPMHRAHWVLRALAPSDSRPALRLGWAPATLVFLANGHGPYTLAYGRDGAAPAARDIAQVAPGLSAVELQTAEQVSPGPEEARAAAAPVTSEARQAVASTQARKGVLWASLAAGLAVLGAMAWQLVRQLKPAPQ
ncbi:DUF3999 family protein [Pseudoduganella buxea]|uniref:DUF3999 family protein n=1 Tax=Pseudoduganella buxea TaxID=1949069 RepID=A0A6I3SZD8_9BURK|nr:DUF3999 family protein [Pseudoduganella buxea]MTV54660.1 DUF3999 family protein [Pseudoduganella buxea]GGC19146.1 hypothetical protein GCM10011572_45800 [Pseudoduganella buxea]